MYEHHSDASGFESILGGVEVGVKGSNDYDSYDL
eukprot:gene12498-512_t